MTRDRHDTRLGGFGYEKGPEHEVEEEESSAPDNNAWSVGLESRGPILPVTTWDDDPPATAAERAYDRAVSAAPHARNGSKANGSAATGSLYPAGVVHDYEMPGVTAKPTPQRDVAKGSREPDLGGAVEQSSPPRAKRRVEAPHRGLEASVERDTRSPAPAIDTAEATLLHVLRDNDADVAMLLPPVVSGLDSDTRVRLLLALKRYRPGMGGDLGELGARFVRLDPSVQRELVEALASPAPSRPSVSPRAGGNGRGHLEAGTEDAIGSNPDAASASAPGETPVDAPRGGGTSATGRSTDVLAYGPDSTSSAAQNPSASAKPVRPPAPPVDPESKYTYRRTRDIQIHIGSVPAKIQFRLEASAKDKGDARTKVGNKANISWGVNQSLIEKSTQGTDLKISSALMKANLELLAEGQLPGPLAHLPPLQVEMKGFEAGLSLKDGAQLKLMSIAVYTQGDLSTLFPDNVQAIAELKGSIRIEWALAPDLAKKMVEAARATDAIKRSVAVETKIAKSEKWLAYYRKRGVRDEIRRLEGELSKLKKLRNGVSKARDEAIEKLVKISAELEKSAMGRLLRGASSKALSKVFGKIIPVYNVISTMQDLYEIGSWFAEQDWAKIGDRIINGGEGGTVYNNGDHDGDGAEPGGGGGFGEGGAGDATDVDADVIERELREEANPELHATAKAVMGLLETKAGDGPSMKLLNEDKQTLNVVIPEDLTPDEIEAMKLRIANARASSHDLVESVIQAIQEVRPFGEKRAGGTSTASDVANQSGAAVTKPERDEPTELERWDKATKPKPKERTKTPPSRVPATWIVDPADTLRSVITIDERTRKPIVPDLVEFPGFTGTVVVNGVAQRSWDSGGEGEETSFMVKVTIIPNEDAPAGVVYVGGHPVKRLVPLPELVVDGVKLRRAQRP